MRSQLEGSHNGIAAVLKTAGSDPVGVRVPRPPLQKPFHIKGFSFLCDVEKQFVVQCVISVDTFFHYFFEGN